MGLDVGFT